MQIYLYSFIFMSKHLNLVLQDKCSSTQNTNYILVFASAFLGISYTMLLNFFFFFRSTCPLKNTVQTAFETNALKINQA